jgi:putative ABC transport system permease protein
VPGGTSNSRLQVPAQAQGVVITSLTDRDVKSLQNKALAPDLTYVSPEVRGQFDVAFGTTDEQVQVAGEDENYTIVRNLTLEEGDWFTKSAVDGFAQVAVLGSKIKDDLFGDQDPVNQIIKIKNLSFRVIGVLEPKGLGPFGVDQDSQVIVPVTTAQKILLGINHYSFIEIQVADENLIPEAEDQVKSVLRTNHNITDPDKDDFTIRTQQDALSLLSTVTSALTIFLGAIAGISLIVGGIGIMNIMLVSVTERTREIGLRKAIGAKRRNILLQFLFEAIILTTIGGIIGVAIGFVGSFGVAKIGNWSPQVPWYAIALAVGVSALFGLGFGIYPANKASKLDPIEALRYE